MKTLAFAAALTAAATGGLVDAKTITATSSNINQAFASAVGGDTLKLSGDFGWTKIQNYTYSSTVYVDASAARFTNSWQINNVTNLTVVGGTFGSAVAATRLGKAVSVFGGSNLSFTNGTYIGASNGGGISVANANGVVVANNSFSDLTVGGGFTEVTGLTLSNNAVTGAKKDGFNIVGSHQVVASHNSCTANSPSPGAHPDCIQLWSIAGKTPTSDIKILNNYASGNTQGFTIFTPQLGGADRVTMSGNVVMGLQAQGIACYGCRDSSFTDNLLVTLAGAPHWVNLNIVGGSNNTKSGNSLIRPGIADPYHPILGQLGYGAGVVPVLAGSRTTKTMTALAKNALAMPTRGIPLGSDDTVSMVPDAPVWITMIAGFGLLGTAMRARRNTLTNDALC